MKKWLCALLSACLLVAQVALAEAPQMGVNELTRRFIADNLDSVDDDPSYQQMGREVSEALGLGEDGMLKPGTRLLKLLTMPQGDELTGNHFAMPSGDWDKLMFMFAQGLMQYELSGSLHMQPDEPLTGSLDGSIEMDAGYDSDGCLSMDGSVLGTFTNADGSGEIQGDDMYARINQQTGEQRIKLPFMDEVNAAAQDAARRDADIDSGGELLLSRMQQDAPHWADALDILYANLRNQPELLPLFRCWFEGGEAPGDVSMTTGQLYRALGRALNDLSADERFADALSQTALLEALYKDGALRFDPAAMSAMQRKFALMGIAAMAAYELNRQDKIGWPSGSLDVKGGNATLNLELGRDRYGDFVAILDASLNRRAGGIDLRTTLIDEAGYVTGARGTHTARINCAEDGHTLLYNFADNYGGDGRHLWLDASEAGLEIEYSGDNDYDPCGSLSIRKQGEAGGYSVLGQLGTRQQLMLRLEGGGEVEGGVATGEIALDAFPDQDGEPVRIGSASYSVGEDRMQLSGSFDNSELASMPTVLGFEMTGSRSDTKFDLRASYSFGTDSGSSAERGHRLRIDGTKRKSKWTGSMRVTPLIGGKAQKDIANGEYTLTARKGGDDLSANLTIMNGSAKIPVRVSASEGARALSLLVSAMQNYKFSLDADLDPDNLLLRYGVSAGALVLNGLELSSHADGERRQSAFEIAQNGQSVQRVELDSNISPIENGYAFEHHLALQPALNGFTGANVDGEATTVLNMQSGSPLVMRQAADFGIEVDGASVTGQFELNHRFYVDERKHRSPRQPQRIEQWIEPEPTEEPEIEQEPEEDEEEYGYPVEPVEDADPTPRATQRPRNTPAPLAPEEAETAEIQEPRSDDELEDIYDAAHYAYTDDGETVRITSYLGEGIDLCVPLEFDGKPVAAIGESAFAGNEAIQSALLPETIAAIDAAAFKGCTGLFWVYIPPSCADIADDAFADCSPTMVIVGDSGSPAQAFAAAQGMYFAAMDEQAEDELALAEPIEGETNEGETAEDAPADEAEIGHQADAPAEDELLKIEPEIID